MAPIILQAEQSYSLPSVILRLMKANDVDTVQTRRLENQGSYWCQFWLIKPLATQDSSCLRINKEESYCIGVTDPDYYLRKQENWTTTQSKIGLLIHNEDMEGYVQNRGDLLGPVLVLQCHVIKINGKLQQSNPSRTTNDLDLSGMKVWVTLPGKEPEAVEDLAEGNGIQIGQ